MEVDRVEFWPGKCLQGVAENLVLFGGEGVISVDRGVDPADVGAEVAVGLANDGLGVAEIELGLDAEGVGDKAGIGDGCGEVGVGMGAAVEETLTDSSTKE